MRTEIPKPAQVAMDKILNAHGLCSMWRIWAYDRTAEISEIRFEIIRALIALRHPYLDRPLYTHESIADMMKRERSVVSYANGFRDKRMARSAKRVAPTCEPEPAVV